MKFSTRARYGLRAMLELALNYELKEPIPLFQIAERQLISEGYLEQMMNVLRKGGLVRSVRGAQGGYLLSREPSRITAGEIVRCLEGPLNPTDCVSEEDPENCVRAEFCVTRKLWERVRVAIATVLDGATLADMCKEAENLRRSKDADMYYI
ncbi:MAG: HTH-type transcriptional regulator CymR [Firmicutes bacterium ADurb.Bin373]|nr:Rrf2 family transcriptional regulator [Bacillota bacterium]OQA09869.1 MAG: HTH-type transcriptional regulator CymR [Firmicutes bacterium ADurb.Bin373]